MTISISKSQIPGYLTSGQLYSTLTSDESFEIDSVMFKETIIINNTSDLYDYIKILDFWLVDDIPKKMSEFIASKKDWDEFLPDEFYFWLFANKSKLILYYFPMITRNEVMIIVHSNDDNLCSRMAKHGYLNALRCAHISGYLWDSNVIRFSMIHGQLDCLKFAIENGCPNKCDHINFKKMINTICKLGHLSILEYAYENVHLFNVIINHEYYYDFDYDMSNDKNDDCDYWNMVTFNASINGHIPILKFAISKNFKISISNDVIFNGHVEYLKLSLEYFSSLGSVNNGQLLTKYCLYDSFNQTKIDINNINNIVEKIEMIKFLYEINCVLPPELGLVAIIKNKLEVLSFVCFNIKFNRNYVYKLYIEAIAQNNLEAIKIIYQSGIDFAKGIYYNAACKGNLDIIKYLHINGCKLDLYTCEGAAEHGHFEILNFFHMNGCSCDYHIS